VLLLVLLLRSLTTQLLLLLVVSVVVVVCVVCMDVLATGTSEMRPWDVGLDWILRTAIPRAVTVALASCSCGVCLFDCLGSWVFGCLQLATCWIAGLVEVLQKRVRSAGGDATGMERKEDSEPGSNHGRVYQGQFRLRLRLLQKVSSIITAARISEKDCRFVCCIPY